MYPLTIEVMMQTIEMLFENTISLYVLIPFIVGEDFENISTIINAHSPPMMACVSINTSKDATFEPTEYFFVKLRIMDPNISFQQPLIRISILNIVSLSLHHSEMSFHIALQGGFPNGSISTVLFMLSDIVRNISQSSDSISSINNSLAEILETFSSDCTFDNIEMVKSNKHMSTNQFLFKFH